jgi:hypothetical protein
MECRKKPDYCVIIRTVYCDFFRICYQLLNVAIHETHIKSVVA